ncbi:MAG: nicotinate (nicotinamide) nucleotide adenylyltransferase [Oscillospiraceae bacterium]|nr:nicotinate (nicotinamide) nucleotide adenylyltransferase [Oscillospiraceae bacterium]
MGAVALFGGSFDPVHLGHVNAVKSLIRGFPEIERVIIMPAFLNPFKAREISGASPMQRVEMCRIAFKDMLKCEVRDFEAKRKSPSYTYVTLRALKEEFPGKEIILAVGSDSLESLPGWKNAEEILANAVIAAAARSEADNACGGGISRYAEEIRRLGGDVRIIPTTPFEISSTEIRKKILKNEDLTCYMDKNVVEYIIGNKIYRGENRS